MTNQDLSEKFSSLRRQAEELTQMVNPATLSLEDARQLVHELQVHQIELEIQNEELRVAHLELENSRRKYSNLYDFSPVGLLTLDDQEHILEANLTMAKMLDVPPDRLIANQLSDFIDPATQDAYHFFFQSLRGSTAPQQCEIALVLSQQSLLYVRLDGIVLTLEGALPTYQVSVCDVTARRQADLQTQELMQERQRMQVLADFIRGTSHDLRTPISSIMTGLYLIGRSANKEDQLKRIESINVQLVQLTHALEQLQQMAVLDSTLTLEFQPDHLHRIVHEVIQNLEQNIAAKDIHIHYNLPENVPEAALNSIHMYQALDNLICNSIQFTPPGGTIALTTYQDGSTLILEITDNGMGIEANALPHIFEHFFKADESRGTRTGGVGLGLPMARRILELHHGSIEVQSTPQVGTTFRLRLPIRTLSD